MGVEFIHDLYNRHEPKINSIRFRHTKTIWKNGIVNSYAPTNEWDRLGKILSEQYYFLDQVLIKSTNDLYQRKREFFHSFIDDLKKRRLAELPNNELAHILIHFQSIVLGELYVLNFVQIEHGLNLAVKHIISEIESDQEKSEGLFIKLIETQTPLASQKEKIELYRVARRYLFMKKIGLANEDTAQKLVAKHYEKYKYLYSAYGEEPSGFDSFWSEFQKYISGEASPIKSVLFPRLLSRQSSLLLKKLNNKKLNVLIPLLVRGGLFRDTNKALLGQSIKYRFEILDEITRRGLEVRNNLNYYLLAEIVDLLQECKKVSINEISLRKDYGVTFIRSEDFKIHTKEGDPQTQSAKNILGGQCASTGTCTGICRIVLTKEDGQKVNSGDIMIAIGTDFDLIEAMYRAGAVVTEEGGILSHASVVCREIGKPCCIGVKNATNILKDGQRINVDATRGKIAIL